MVDMGLCRLQQVEGGTIVKMWLQYPEVVRRVVEAEQEKDKLNWLLVGGGPARLQYPEEVWRVVEAD